MSDETEVIDDKERYRHYPRIIYNAEEHVEMAYQLARQGLSQGNIALAMGVCRQTIHTWREKHPEFEAAYRRGRTELVKDVMMPAGIRAAVGHTEVVVTTNKNKNGEVIGTTEQEIYTPPNTKIFIHLLNNYSPEFNENAERDRLFKAQREKVEVEIEMLKDSMNPEKEINLDAKYELVTDEKTPEKPIL